MFFPHIFYSPCKLFSLPHLRKDYIPSLGSLMVTNSKILGIYFTTCNIYTKNPQKAQVKKTYTKIILFVTFNKCFDFRVCFGNLYRYICILYLLLFFFTFSKCKACHNYKTHSCCIVPNCGCATCLRKCLGMALLCLKSV